MTEPKRYVTCEYHHPSCLPGWGHFETESCINPMVAVIPPKFQQFADSGATEFPILDRFPTAADGPGGAIRLAPPDELRKREVLDEIEMAKRFQPSEYDIVRTQRDMLAAELVKVEAIIRECFRVYPNPDGDQGWLKHFYKHPTIGGNLTDEQAELLRSIVESQP